MPNLVRQKALQACSRVRPRYAEVQKKLWYQQLRTQVSQSEVETEAIETAAASTANNYVEAKRLSRFLTRSIPSYTDGIEQRVAKFCYELPWKVGFEKLEGNHSDRQQFKNLRSKDELMEEMSASRQESQVVEGETLSTLVG